MLAVALIGLVVAGATTGFFGLANSLPNAPVGRTVPLEGADHVSEGTAVTYKSRPPASGAALPELESDLRLHGPAAAYRRLAAQPGARRRGDPLQLPSRRCPELEQQLKDLYPTLPLGRNARGGQPRAIIQPYSDMDHKIAVVAWGWLLELDEFDRDQIVRFYESRIDRGPECRDLACP